MNPLRLEDIKVGMDLFIANPRNFCRVGIEKVHVGFGPFQKPLLGTSTLWIKQAYFTHEGEVKEELWSLQDMGVIRNTYNKTRTFRTEPEAKDYIEFLKTNPQGLPW